MRLVPFGLILSVLLFAIPSPAKQGSQQPSPAQVASDPQAVAVVQTAITALGGATAISQAETWTFRADMQGPHANGDVNYAISTDTDTGKVMRKDGTMKPAPLIHSHFVPALVGAILLKESQDSTFTIQYGGTSTLDSKPVTVITFFTAVGTVILPAQIWSFDAANLPVRVDFRFPAEIGGRRSFPGMVALADYRSVSGVLYPFRIVSRLPGWLPQIILLQSVAASTVASPNEFNGPGGDLP